MAETQIKTFGCRLNSFESEIMRSNANAAGIEDAIIFNTCAVTAEAQRQARQAIRKARRNSPESKIIVTGCAAQIDPQTFADMPEVDQVIGNEEKLKAETFTADSFNCSSDEKIRVNDIMSVTETAPQLLDGFSERARAFVQIQNGCDHRCTFCIIPYGRGNSRSVPAGNIIRQIEKLAESGHKEVVLTGVDITAYGADLPGSLSLGKLVQKILDQVPDLPRLRLSSIDSVEIDEPLRDAICNNPRLMPHIHLSLQAGDNMILKRMKRRHLREHSVAFCNEIQAARPDVVFGADLIAGFPTETEQMFENSLALVEDCNLTWLHVFPYSPRPGTPAARMPQVDTGIVKLRAARLRAAGDKNRRRFLDSLVGSTTQALVETPTSARTGQFAPVELSGSAEPGSLINVHITGATRTGLEGETLI